MIVLQERINTRTMAGKLHLKQNSPAVKSHPKGGNKMKQARVRLFFIVCMALIIGSFPVFSYAATAGEIDANVNASLDRFVKEVKGAQEFLTPPRGSLSSPRSYRAGLWSAPSMAREP